MPTRSPARQATRSRSTAMMSWLPIRQTTCVSAPVGSTTTTSAASPCEGSASARCSGRMPYRTSRPSSGTPGAATSPPIASATRVPEPLRRTTPANMFIAGEPMNPATNVLSGSFGSQ